MKTNKLFNNALLVLFLIKAAQELIILLTTKILTFLTDYIHFKSISRGNAIWPKNVTELLLCNRV